MSMRSSFTYGMGFEVDKVSALAMVEFIKNHKEAFCQSEEEKQIFNDLEDTDNGIFSYNYMEDFFDNYDYTCDNFCGRGFGAVISNIMGRETGIRFEYQEGQDDCGSVPTVMLPETLPWCYNEIEKNLTEERFYEICDKYMQELGLEGRADYMEVEYFG